MAPVAETVQVANQANEVKEEIQVLDFVPDLPLSEHECAFNVAAQGKHRQCERYPREQIGGYGFCAQHAAIVAARITTTGERS